MKKIVLILAMIISLFLSNETTDAAINNRIYYEEIVSTTLEYKQLIDQISNKITFPKKLNEELRSSRDNTYRIGVLSNEVTYNSINDQYVGTGELLRYYYEKVFEAQFIIVPFENYDDLINALEQREIDFAFPLISTFDRQSTFDFTEGIQSQNLYIYSKTEFDTLYNINNIKMGYLSDMIVDELLLDFNYHVTKIEFNTLEEAANALKNNTIDCFFDTAYSYSYLTSKGYYSYNIGEHHEIKPLSVASLENNHAGLIEGMDYVDVYFRTMIENYNDKILKLYSRINIAFTKEEVEFIKSLERITVNLFPYSKYVTYDDDSKRYSGLSVEILDEITKILDVKYIVTSEPNQNYYTLYNDVRTKKVDMLGFIYQYPELTDDVYLTTSYHKIKLNIIKLSSNTKKMTSLRDLRNESVGVVKGDYYYHLLNNIFPGKEIKTFDTYRSLYEAFDKGKIDYIIMEYDVYVDYYNNHRKSNWVIDYTFTDEVEVSFAFSKTDEGRKLSNLFSKIMSTIEIKDIENHYIKETLDTNKYQMEQRYFVIIIIMTGSLVIIAFMFLFRIRKSKIAKINFKNDQMKIQMLRNLSHDLTIPLTISKVNAQMLEKGYYKKDNIDEKLKAIVYGINQTDKVIKDINSLLNIENTLKRDKYNDQVNVKHFFREITMMFESYGKEKNIKFTFNPDPEDLVIKTNEHYFKRLIYNILDNAFKYNVNDGEVSLSYIITKQVLIVMVKDTGIGMSKANLERVFEQFFKVDHSRKDEGYGLGLTIVKKIADEFGAKINISSELNIGTKIEIRIPIKGGDSDE